MMKEICSFHPGWNHICHNEERFLHLHLTYSLEGNALTYDLLGTKSYTLVKMAPSPRLSYLVMDQVPPFSQRMEVALISNLVGTKSYTLARMACTHI